MNDKNLPKNILKCIDTFEHEDGHCFVYELCKFNLEKELIDLASNNNPEAV